MSRDEQIAWIVEWVRKEVREERPVSLDARNYVLWDKFAEETGAELHYRVWRERIRSAAGRLGMTGFRMYNGDPSPGAGIPHYSMVYTFD